MFFRYLRKLIKKWYFYLSVIPAFIGFAEIYFNIGIKITPVYIWIFVGVAILFASYKIWSEEFIEKINLQSQLSAIKENSSDFVVKAYAKKIIFNIEEFSKKLDLKCIEAQRLILETKKEIEKYTENLSENDFNKFDLISKKINSSLIPCLKPFDEEKYIIALKNYIKNLEDYVEKKSQYINDFNNIFKNELCNIYSLSLSIMNTGLRADVDIDVKVFINDPSFYCESYYIDGFILNYLKLPIKPKKADFSTVLQINPPVSFKNNILDFNYPISGAYYTNETISKNELSVTLRDLKASDTAQLFSDKLYMKIENIKDLTFSVLSSNASHKIEKQVEVIFDKDEVWKLEQDDWNNNP